MLAKSSGFLESNSSAHPTDHILDRPLPALQKPSDPHRGPSNSESTDCNNGRDYLFPTRINNVAFWQHRLQQGERGGDSKPCIAVIWVDAISQYQSIFGDSVDVAIL